MYFFKINVKHGFAVNLQATDDEETSKVNNSRSECQKFSTSQGTAALMLGSNEQLRASCEDQVTGTSTTAGCGTVSVSDTCCVDSILNEESANRYVSGAVETGESKMEGRAASRPASSCSSGSSSSSSDIQQHLQSMFCLLRPEETLKMAVKLESLRTGRTRYLVVVSRTVTSKRHNTGTLYLTGGGSSSNGIGSTTNGSIVSSWPLSATPPATFTTIPAAAQQQQQPLHGGRSTCSTLSGTVTAVTTTTTAHTRHSSCTGEPFAGIDTFVSTSVDSCVLNVRLPDGSDVPCRSDQCDSKTSSRLIDSTTAVPGMGDGSDDTCSTPTGPDEVTVADKRDTESNESATACCQGQELQQGHQYQNQHSISNSAIATMEGGKKIEESCLLGIDCNERTTVGLVLKVLADTSIRLDGDGGFSVSSCGKQHIFKPVSVQAMWSALQTLHKASFKAREHNFFAGGPSHDWVSYYEAHIDSDRSCLNEWNAMDSLESRRPPSPGSIRSKPTEREETESVIRSKLKEVMMSVDLDDVTSKFIRGRLEELLDMDLGEYKPFIDAEMLVILGQMDAPTEIFDHVYLGSEWNASNLEELQRNGVHHILNVTREIDNFFPGLFHYCNVRVYDDEKTDLLRHWDNTFKFISRAKMEGSKVLVHCKMGISRSASVVIAYAMKANGWNFEHALRHVKEKRSCIKPNKNFLMQLETYQGMLDAMKNKEKLQRSKSETNLKLAGAKEGRSLPGSEPTPLIQALNGAVGVQAGGGKKHLVVSAAGKAGHNHADADDGDVSASVGVLGEKADFEPRLDGADEADGDEAGASSRGRTRTRQSKLQSAHPHNLKQLELAGDGSSSSAGTDTQSQSEQQTTLPAAACTASSTSKHSKLLANLFLPATTTAGKAFIPCEGRICGRGSGALKRHKSLSPDSFNPRWSDSYEFESSSLAYAEKSFPAASRTSRTRTMLELDNQIEPYVGSGAPCGGTGRRKQQSYSLEHLHGGALDMRSPCTETKTIRMPCGNGQNYSVSPNQIVHLQDKLPPNDVRKKVLSSLAAAATTSSTAKPNRSESFIRKLFPSSSSSSSSSSSGGGAGTSDQDSGCSSQSLATSVPSTVPSSTSTLLGSTVKAIVSELECNSGSNIPIAPPPLLNDPGTLLSQPVAPIPIASVAAEAAAVAVASAIREATRKDVHEAKEANATAPASSTVSLDGKGDNRTNNPEQWDPGDGRSEPICWTSSAQIIQQCSAAVGGFTEPAPTDAPAAAGSMECCEVASESDAGSCCKPAPEVSVLRQCSWSSCDSGCTGSEESRAAGPQVNQQRRLTTSGPPGVVNSSSSGGSGSGALIDERDVIPWHPGTVKRTKKRIEQRSTNVASTVTMKWNTPSTTVSTLPTATSAVSTDTGAHGDDLAASCTTQQHSQKEQQEEGYPAARERPGMVSSSYARLSASAPDSYNLYAEPGSRSGESVGSTNPLPAKRQVKPNHQHSFAGAGCDDSVPRNPAESSTSYCLRVSVRGAGGVVERPQQSQPHEPGDGAEEDTFNAGKVRNLKMSFEAKSNDRRQGPKKVRSLPSSPVAVHVSMGSQAKRPPATSSATTSTTTATASSPSSPSPLAGLVSGPATGQAAHQSTTPPEDVTVRDLVDRYEVQGPRVRPVGSSSLSRTQRPRSVFEPLKQSSTGGKPFAQSTTNNLLSHSATQWRLDDSMRPPVPPLVRGLVLAQHGAGTAPYNNKSTNVSQTAHVPAPGRGSSGPGIGTNSSSNARNNNNTAKLMLQQSGGSGEAGSQVGGKRTQQHGRTHPLAKISPSAKHHHHHLHVHHHLVHHHHQYNIGQLQQHRHIGTAPGPGVSGATGPSATVTANAYNTM
uniref:protein-serine/threonine phosphatase n=1 Tax=Anopheles stephensi TaxID=30069 RepID=A0A182Y4V5_ANOST